jgi:hypothetical protein
MLLLSLGSTDLEQLFRPKPVGEPVNTHVVERVKEPAPDFDAMRRIVETGVEREKAPARDEPESRKVPARD